jgi:hypothetical protein
MRGLHPLVLTLALAVTACWRIGEPTESEAVVAWAAFPDTVVAGELFSFEFAGPVSQNACGRLDTALVQVQGRDIRLTGRRSMYDTMCSNSPVAFYEARPFQIDSVGTYQVSAEGVDLGGIVVVDAGRFSPMRARGEGTVTEAGGCLLFGPGWVGNQRPFALRGADTDLQSEVDTGRRVHVIGDLAGFRLCGPFGSRPVIAVDTSWVTDRTVDDYYRSNDSAEE